MKMKLGLITLAVLSLAITSCSYSPRENAHKSSDNSDMTSEADSNSGASDSQGISQNSDSSVAPSSASQGEQSSSSSQQAEKFTVTWKNYDGSILEIDYNVTYGATPSYDYETPVKPSDDQYNYVFVGWTPEVSTVTSDQTYTATFDTVSKVHTHEYVKNLDTLEYVCSCGEKNGRDYEMNITLPTLHAGDIYKSRDYTYSFKNDDEALVLGIIEYSIGEQQERIHPGKGSNYAIPDTFLGQSVVATVVVGVHDGTNIKYAMGNTQIGNLDVFINGQLARKDRYTEFAENSTWLPADQPSVINRRYYEFKLDLGKVLVAWPKAQVDAAFRAMGLEPFALPALEHEIITSYDVDSHADYFVINFNGLENQINNSYVYNFYYEALIPLGFTLNGYSLVSPDGSFVVDANSTSGLSMTVYKTPQA